MSEEFVFEAPDPVERRIDRRHRTQCDVFISLTGGGNVHCRAVDLSARGVGIRAIGDRPLALQVGAVIKMTFALKFDNGLTKLHRRKATVKHVHNGIVGLQMENTRTC